MVVCRVAREVQGRESDRHQSLQSSELELSCSIKVPIVGVLSNKGSV